MKASSSTIRARVEAVLTLLLDGAELWDVRQYVSEKQSAAEAPWMIPEGGKALSERQIRRYCERAEDLIQEAQRTNRRKLIRRHLARHWRLYAKSVGAGDYRAALACLRDEAELQGLYPPKGIALGGKGGGPVELRIIEEVTGSPEPPIDEVEEDVVTRDATERC
jgi:hypothetical protein